MERVRPPDVVVVGGGIIGCSIAQHLLDEGARVSLVDRGSPGVSEHSFGEVSALRAGNRDEYLLASAGMSEWRRWARRLGVGPSWAGAVAWETDTARGRELSEMVRRAQERGYPVRSLNASSLATRLPAAELGPIAAACIAPDDGYVDLAEIIKACRKVIAAEGGTILSHTRAELSFGSGEVTVHVDGQEHRPTQVVVAAGTATPEAFAPFGLDLQLRPSPVLLIRLGRSELALPFTVHLPSDDGRHIALRSGPDDTMLIQSGAGVDPSPKAVTNLVRHVRHYFPGLEHATVEHTVLEWRPVPADGLPVIGPISGLEHLFLALSPQGATTAPAVGRMVARRIVHDERGPLDEAFSSARFGARALETELDVEAIFSERSGGPAGPIY